MSDFDKEAEREKLREKFEQEDEQRAATEQMSELLLKGATMTNAHCTDCGDPIFRHDGQEFCPTCQKPVAREQSGETDAASDGDHIEVADPSDEAHVQFGDGDDQAPAQQGDAQQAADQQPQQANTHQPDPQRTADQPADTQRQPETPKSQADAGAIPSADPERTPPQGRRDDQAGAPSAGDHTAERTQSSTDTQSPPADPSGSVAEDLTAAESLLAQTVTRFARRANETDDPRVARDHLAAAREAAEALDAVRY